MATADISAIAFFAPIAAFLIVTIVVYAVLLKSQIIGENHWAMLFTSFFVASIFVSVAGAQQYIQTIVPWFAVLLVSLIFLMAMLGFIGGDTLKVMTKPVGIAFAIILLLVFLISGFLIYSNTLIAYLPGPGFGTAGNIESVVFLDWLYSPRIVGAIFLIGISALVSWILVKK